MTPTEILRYAKNTHRQRKDTFKERMLSMYMNNVLNRSKRLPSAKKFMGQFATPKENAKASHRDFLAALDASLGASLARRKHRG